MLKQGLNYVKSRMREAAAQAHPGIPAASKNIFMDCCVRAPCVLRRSQMCRLSFDLGTRRNREPATLTLGIFCVRTEISCRFRQSWGHTWIAIHAQEDMDLNHDQQTSSCDENLLRSRAAGTLGSLSVRKETCSCEKIVAISRRPQYR